MLRQLSFIIDDKRVNLVVEIWVWIVAFYLIVKNYLLLALVGLGCQFQIITLDVQNTSWFFGADKGLGEKVAIVGAVIGVVYKFVVFISPRFKRFIEKWRNKK